MIYKKIKRSVPLSYAYRDTLLKTFVTVFLSFVKEFSSCFVIQSKNVMPFMMKKKTFLKGSSHS